MKSVILLAINSFFAGLCAEVALFWLFHQNYMSLIAGLVAMLANLAVAALHAANICDKLESPRESQQETQLPLHGGEGK